MKKGLLILISAPSGAGKTSLVNEIVVRDKNLIRSISHTTRIKRIGEEHRKDYFFVTATRFEDMVRDNEFIEYAEVFDNFYGTSKMSVNQYRSQGLDVLLEIDWQGASQVQDLNPDAVSIFIVPPGKQELETRLIKRNKDSKETISRRLSQAKEDMEKARNYNYVIVNDLFEKAADKLLTIIAAERLKTVNQLFNNDLVRSLLSAK